jgi:hypothetical protein
MIAWVFDHVRDARRWTAALTVLGAILLSVGCSSKIGSNGSASGASGPRAVITPIGQIPTSAAGVDPVTITVRSGADVVLSAKESDGGAAALTQFTWSKVSGPNLPRSPDPGALTYRNNNTVSFTVPQVTSASDPIKIQLTIKTSNGGTASANAVVNILPADDQNRFLIPPQTAASASDNHFVISVLSSDGLGTSTANPLPDARPACIQVARQITYTARDGTQHTTPASGSGSLTPLHADVTWAQGTVVTPTHGDSDIDDAVQSYTNPRASFVIPSVNDEELFELYNQPPTQPGSQLVPSDIDSASLQLSVQAVPGTCASPTGAASSLTVALLAQTDSSDARLHVIQHSTAGSTLSLDADVLRTSLGTQPVQTKASARAYYQAIDPSAYTDHDSKATLSGWLTANCFDPKSADYGTGKAAANGAHGVYTNNFDLGFGRDMYFIQCTADQQDQYGNTTAHAGDMASVVINYPTLEQAALKDSPIIAVAMEYSAAPDGSGRRFPKFYIYAPDDRTGELNRVLSANFDRRGQKFLPGACTVCHGGNLPSLPQTFVGPSMTAGLAQPTACAAGASFDTTACYPLVADPTSTATCNQATGSNGCLAAGDIDSAFLPWDADAFLYSDAASTANRDPAFLGTLIAKTAFTRQAQEPNLKALNRLAYATWQPEIEAIGLNKVPIDRYAAVRTLVEQWYGGSAFPNATYTDLSGDSIPPGWKNQPAATPIYHEVFARNCRTCHMVNANPQVQFSGFNDPDAGGHNLAGDGYTLFNSSFTQTTKLGQSYVFQQGIMPLARLTMDRFWVDFANPTEPAKSSAALLASALNLSGTNATLGAPLASVTTTIGTSSAPAESDLTCSSTTQNAITRGDTIRLSADSSNFAANPTWNLSYSSCDPKFSSSSVLVGSNTSLGAFNPDKPGLYTATLNVDNGGAAKSQQTASFLLANKYPTLIAPQGEQPVSYPVGQTLSLSGVLGDGDCSTHHFSAQPGTGAVTLGACTPGTSGAYTLAVGYVPSAVGTDSFSVSVQDVDGDCPQPSSVPDAQGRCLQPAVVAVRTASTLTAPPNEAFSAQAGTSATDTGYSDHVAVRCELSVVSGETNISLSVGSNASSANTTNGHVDVLIDTDGSKGCGVGKQYLAYKAHAHFIGTDTIHYTATGNGGAQDTLSANIAVVIKGTVDFASDLFPQFNGYTVAGSTVANGCASCHGPTPLPPASTHLVPAAVSSPVSATVSGFYQALCGASGGSCTPQGISGSTTIFAIVPGDAADSLVYTEPNLVSPPSPMPSFNGTTFIKNLGAWVNEGAYVTCSSDASACLPKAP